MTNKYFDRGYLDAIFDKGSAPKKQTQPKPKKKWKLDTNWTNTIVFEVNTKSEARALLKKKLNISRIPVGTYLTEVA